MTDITSYLQVQALVAEHKLGAEGRRLGVAMTKELINTPGRLARVKPAASTSWAAIKQQRNFAHMPNKSCSLITQSTARTKQIGCQLPAAQAQADSAQSLAEEQDVELKAVSAESSRDGSDIEDGVPVDTMRSTVQFTSPELIEDGAQVKHKGMSPARHLFEHTVGNG